VHTIGFLSTFTGTETITFRSFDSNPAGTWAIDDVSIKSTSSISPALTVTGYDGSTWLSLGSSLLGNTFLGKATGTSTTTGTWNTAVGLHALTSNVNGSLNAAFGEGSLFSDVSGSENTGFGEETLFSNISGDDNTALGIEALYHTTASRNTAVGAYALFYDTTGANNTAFGYNAGQFLANGSTANQTPSSSLFLGYDTRASVAGGTNEIVIGASTTGNGSNTVTLGNASITNTYLRGAVTISGLSVAGIVTNTSGGVLGTTATIPVANGGTNIASYTIGDLLYASGATTLSKLADVATGSCLISGGVGVAPSWGNCGTGNANTALSNLASVAINTSLLPGANDTINLGDDTHRWADLFLGGETIHIGTSVTDEATVSYTTSTNLLNFSTDSTSNGDIAFFSDDLYLDKSVGFVGIGTTTPTNLLEVGSEATGGNMLINGTLGAEQAPSFAAANWTLTAGWEATNDGGTQLNKNADGVTTATPSAATTIVVGTTYKVVITTTITVGNGFTWSVGGITGAPITTTGTYTQYFKAVTTGKLILTPTPTTTRFTVSAISIKPVTANTGDIATLGNMNLSGLLKNPGGTIGLQIDPNGQARFGGALAMTGALSGATTGAFSNTITNTVGALVMGAAAGTTSGLIETNTTASTAVAPIQVSPSVEWRGTAFDSASKTHNWKTYANVMYDATTGTSRLATQYGYNAVTQVAQTERMSLGSEGTLDIFGTTLGSESLTNGALTSGTSWSRTGDMALTANTAVYTHSTGSGTLSQASGTLAVAGVANRWYQFSYVTATVTTGVTCYIDPTFAQKRIYLNLVAGTYVVNFKAAAAPGNFTLTCTSTAGAVTFDTFSLKEVKSGDIIANGLFTGGGTTGLKIDGAGNVGIGDTTPAALFTVGNNDLFQVNSSGAIAAVVGITSTGTIATTALTASSIIQANGGITSTAGVNITPAAGSSFSVSLVSTGDFVVNSDHLYVDTSVGNVGIGTTAPGFKLEVATARSLDYVANFFNDGNDADRYGIRIQAGADDGSGTTYYLNALDGDGGQVGYIANTAGTFALTDVSDVRTKTNISDTRFEATTILDGLRVVDFNRKSNPNGALITGFIAQEVQTVYPNAVTQNEDGLLGIMKDAFVPLLVKGFQENDERLTTVEKSLSVVELKTNENITTLTGLQNSVDEQLQVVGNNLLALEQKDAVSDARFVENESRLGNMDSLIGQLNLDLSAEVSKTALLETQVATLADQVSSLVDFYATFNMGAFIAAETNGDVSITGKLKAKILETGGISIEVVDVDAPTIGTAVITPVSVDVDNDGKDDETGSDGKSVEVMTKAMMPMVKGSRIFTNFKDNPSAFSWVEKIKTAEGDYVGFRVKLSQPITNPVKLDWWLIEQKDNFAPATP